MSNEEQILNILNQINNRLGSLENRIDKLENRFDNLEKRFDVLEDRFDKLEKRFDVLEERVDNIEGQQKENITILRALEHRAEENSAKIEGMCINNAKEFGEIKASINRLEEKIDDISLAVNEHEQAIFRLKRKAHII